MTGQDSWVGARVRLGNPRDGFQTFRGTITRELCDNHQRAYSVALIWDGRQNEVWFLVRDLVKIDH